MDVILLEIYTKIREILGDAYLVMNINGYTIVEDILRNWGRRLIPEVEWFYLAYMFVKEQRDVSPVLHISSKSKMIVLQGGSNEK